MRKTMILGMILALLFSVGVAAAAEEVIVENLTIKNGEQTELMNCEIDPGVNLTIQKEAVLTFKGDCVNNGTILNEGTIQQLGQLENEGIIKNQGEFINNQVMDNQDTFENYQSFINRDTGKINNDSLFSNRGKVDNQGQIINNSTWQNISGSVFSGKEIIGSPGEDLTVISQGSIYARTDTRIILTIVAVLILVGIAGVLLYRKRK